MGNRALAKMFPICSPQPIFAVLKRNSLDEHADIIRGVGSIELDEIKESGVDWHSVAPSHRYRKVCVASSSGIITPIARRKGNSRRG